MNIAYVRGGVRPRSSSLFARTYHQKVENSENVTKLIFVCHILVVFGRFRLREWQNRISHEELLRVDGVYLSGDWIFGVIDGRTKGRGPLRQSLQCQGKIV